ncbi:hypothetical protein TUM3792_21790 [Shewanella sp. MBTL60-007]|nr:hypothetical protein TUM3792_21790 [Shewanella sp. MBTL60-007]
MMLFDSYRPLKDAVNLIVRRSYFHLKWTVAELTGNNLLKRYKKRAVNCPLERNLFD